MASAWLTASGALGQVFVTTQRGHGLELARAAVERRDALVIAWGGDGTVNEVASALVGTSVPLALVPAGSGNGLARDLGIPMEPRAALEYARARCVRAIDAGQLGGRYFFTVAGIGFDARVAAEFDRQAGGQRGFRTYVRVTARELRRYQAADYRIDGTAVCRAFLITFANASQFGNGARIAPGARLDDGLLDMVVFQERSRLATIVNLPRLFTGRIRQVPGVSITQAREAVVHADAPITFHVDGEPASGGCSVRAVVQPGALCVVAR
jgi:YegS/Rv2252/BmrU family lipid kinase